MKVAFLPLNAGPETEAALARQLSALAADLLKIHTEDQVNPVTYMGQIMEGGVPRYAMVPLAEELNAKEVVEEFFKQSDTDLVIDGLLIDDGSKGELTSRIWQRDQEGDPQESRYPYEEGGLIGAAHQWIKDLLDTRGAKLKEEFASVEGTFGTESEEALRKFLTGSDSVFYIERAQGMTSKHFSPEPAVEALKSAIQIDPDWEGPELALLQLVRVCTRYRLGSFAMLEDALKVVLEREQESGRAHFVMGELLLAGGDASGATDHFEKAHRAEPEESSILIHLGRAQIAAQMPINAERSFKRASELEGEDQVALDHLAETLRMTNRAHEIPDLYRAASERFPQSGNLRAKLALSLWEQEKREEAATVLENALSELDDPIPVKRAYAPILAKGGNNDRAMDLYEDCIDANPTDVGLLIEYAQTLQAADRQFEVPKVLRDALACNPDLNTKAQIDAWLIEIEQPKRIETINSASQKLEAGDFQGAVEDLKTLKSWMGDYWKFWAMLALANNRLNQYEDAEQAARKVLEMFPAYELGYAELNGALAGQRKFEEAYNLMKIAITNMPQSLVVAINYALAANRAGDRDEAVKIAAQIREATQGNQDVEAALAEIGG